MENDGATYKMPESLFVTFDISESIVVGDEKQRKRDLLRKC